MKENHPESQKIIDKSKEVSHMWEELKECSQSRQEVNALCFFIIIVLINKKSVINVIEAFLRHDCNVFVNKKQNFTSTLQKYLLRVLTVETKLEEIAKCVFMLLNINY